MLRHKNNNNNKKRAPDFRNNDIFGSIQFSCFKFVQDGFLQLQPGLLTGCSLMPGRLKRQNPQESGRFQLTRFQLGTAKADLVSGICKHICKHFKEPRRLVHEPKHWKYELAALVGLSRIKSDAVWFDVSQHLHHLNKGFTVQCAPPTIYTLRLCKHRLFLSLTDSDVGPHASLRAASRRDSRSRRSQLLSARW